MESTARALAPGRVHTARAVAITADLVQIVFFPVFLPGIASVVDDVFDTIVALLMFFLVGWHWSFLPSFAAKMVPGLDLVPTWTAAVFIATRGRKEKPRDEGAIAASVVSSTALHSDDPAGNPMRGTGSN